MIEYFPTAIENLDQVLDKLSIRHQVCKGPIWESILPCLKPQFGPGDIVGVILNYALLEQTNDQETIPPQLELHELVGLVKKVAEIRNGLNENLLNHTYNAISMIYDDPDKYRLLVYCVGPIRPTMKELKKTFEEVNQITEQVNHISKSEVIKVINSFGTLAMNLSYHRDNPTLRKLTGWVTENTSKTAHLIADPNKVSDNLVIPLAERSILIYEGVLAVLTKIQFDPNSLGTMKWVEPYISKYKNMGLQGR